MVESKSSETDDRRTTGVYMGVLIGGGFDPGFCLLFCQNPVSGFKKIIIMIIPLVISEANEEIVQGQIQSI